MWWAWHTRPKAVEYGDKSKANGVRARARARARAREDMVTSTVELVSEATGAVDLTTLKENSSGKKNMNYDIAM